MPSTLSELPEMGKVAELELEREYRELVVDHLKIYYFLDGPRVVIARLWHTPGAASAPPVRQSRPRGVRPRDPHRPANPSTV